MGGSPRTFSFMALEPLVYDCALSEAEMMAMVLGMGSVDAGGWQKGGGASPL